MLLDLDRHLDQRRRARRPRPSSPVTTPSTAAQRAHGPPDDLAPERVGEQLGRARAAGRVNGIGPWLAGNGQHVPSAEVDLVLDGLVPGHPPRRRRRRRTRPARSRRPPVAASMLAVLHLQAPDPHRQRWRRARDRRPPRSASPTAPTRSAAATAGGTSTPNCHRSWFLRAEAAVRVEHVALVEHGVGHRPGGGEAVGRRAHAPSSPASLSSCSSVSSQVGRARAALNRVRASSVSGDSRTHPLLGK